MYNIKSKMMSANNEMKINEIVKNFYEQNPNSEIVVVPISNYDDDIIYETWEEFGKLRKDKLIEEAKKLGARVLVRDNKTKIIEKIITIKLNAHKIEKKIEIDFTDKKEDINTEMTTANSNTEMMNDTRYVRDCCIDKEAFDEYLADSIPTKMKTKMDKYVEGNEEEPMECMRFGLTNPTDRKGLEYSVCMLVDCEGGYMPIFKTGINTSSYFAMWSCGIDRDYDDEEEIPKMTINEIAEMCCEEYRDMFVKMCEKIEQKSHKIEIKVEAEPEDKTPIKLNDCKIEKLNEKEPESKIIDNTEMNANTNTNTAPKIVVSAPEEIKHIAEGLERAIAVRQSNHHRNTGNMEVSSELPLFMREGGEEEIDKRRKELETYLKLLNANPEQMIRGHTLVILNQATLDPNEVGAEQARAIQKWFDTPKTKQEIREWLGCGTHKADGKSWNCGFMGSRWADKKINGRPVRFAFYADKDKKPPHLKHLAYSIIIDASM